MVSSQSAVRRQIAHTHPKTTEPPHQKRLHYLSVGLVGLVVFDLGFDASVLHVGG